MNNELIWVIPADGLRGPLHRPNFLYSQDAMFVPTGGDVANPEDLPCMGELFMTRSAAEQNEAFLQPIPYVILVQGGRYVRYRRLPRSGQGGEGRLTGRTSIGAGGHLSASALDYISVAVQKDDTDDHSDPRVQTKNRLIEEIWRELREEFDFKRNDRKFRFTGCVLDFRGYLLDRRDPVGRVHLGLVYTLNLPDDVRVDIHSDEAHKLRLEAPLDPDDADVDPELEGWSELIVRLRCIV